MFERYIMAKFTDIKNVHKLESGQDLYEVEFFTSLEEASKHFRKKTKRKYCHVWNMEEGNKYIGYTQK